VSLGCRIVDVTAETLQATVVRLLAGSADVKLPDGGSWSEVLSVQDVQVAKDQYVNVLARNDSDAPARLRATVRVVWGAASVGTAGVLTKARVVMEITEPGEPVRFLLGRGLVPYLLMFLKGGGNVPRQMHSAVLASFEGTRMVRGEKHAPIPRGQGQEVEVTLGEHVRTEIAQAVRFRTAPRMSMADRTSAAEAIADAAGPGEAKKPATVVTFDVETKNAARLRSVLDVHEENKTLKARVAELEKILAEYEPGASLAKYDEPEPETNAEVSS
jgi:hypothetical protein